MASTRLSPSLKALLSASHASPGPLPAPPQAALTALFTQLATSGTAHGVAEATWLTLGSAALVTLNSPASLCALYSFAVGREEGKGKEVLYAAVMREVGLKSISFSGIPRAINNLGALRAHLPDSVASALPTTPTREPSPSSLSAISDSAHTLWTSIYAPFSSKLLSKLSLSHPDLPVHILNSHYGPLLSDPPSSPTVKGGKIGRILTSVVAIACLRAQGGVGPQVTSHVFGLRKAAEELGELTGEEKVEGAEWLTSDEGAKWVVEQVDRIVETVTQGRGSSFGTRAKL